MTENDMNEIVSSFWRSKFIFLLVRVQVLEHMKLLDKLIKSVADTTDKLADLQKKVKDLDEDGKKDTTNVTNNAMFVGSTADLQKMLKQGFLNNNDKK